MCSIQICVYAVLLHASSHWVTESPIQYSSKKKKINASWISPLKARWFDLFLRKYIGKNHGGGGGGGGKEEIFQLAYSINQTDFPPNKYISEWPF